MYRFYLFRSERRNGPRFVACKAVTTPRSAAVDAYGKAVTHRRACDECGAAFEKRGRRKFCSTQCGARARKRRFLGKPAPQRRHRPTWRYTEQTESEIWRNHAIQTAAATRKDWRGNRAARQSPASRCSLTEKGTGPSVEASRVPGRQVEEPTSWPALGSNIARERRSVPAGARRRSVAWQSGGGAV